MNSSKLLRIFNPNRSLGEMWKVKRGRWKVEGGRLRCSSLSPLPSPLFPLP